jgi:hypothetical protein
MLKSDLTINGMIKFFGIEEQFATFLGLTYESWIELTGIMNLLWTLMILGSLILIV